MGWPLYGRIQAVSHGRTEAVVADLAVPRGWRRFVDPRLTGAAASDWISRDISTLDSSSPDP